MSISINSLQYSTQFKRLGHFHFFTIRSSAKPRPMINVISQSLGLDLATSMCKQNFITIFQSVQEIGPFLYFQNSELGKASTYDKYHFAISWAILSYLYQCVCISLSKYSSQFKRLGHFHFFRVWSLTKPRPTINVILQSRWLDLVNINMYTKFHHNIPLSSRDRAIYMIEKFSGDT